MFVYQNEHYNMISTLHQLNICHFADTHLFTPLNNIIDICNLFYLNRLILLCMGFLDLSAYFPLKL